MRQIIPFKKDIILKTRIAEMTSISLEHNLKLEDDSVIGELILTGDYKMTEASINREEFEYKLPFEITLTDKYNLETFSVDIDDFYYEIINNDVLRINVELLIMGDEEIIDIKNTKDDDVRMIEDEKVEFIPEIKEKIEEINEEVKEEIKITGEKIKTLFDSLDDDVDDVESYNVHIMREEDTIDTIMNKYNITKEELKDYNDVDNITIGAKIIVPVPKLDE